MFDAISARLKRLEKEQNALPHAIVTFSDGHRERLGFHQVALAFFEQNKAGIAFLEWERTVDNTIIFQLLSNPDTWTTLKKKGQFENDQNETIL